jgi:hypothetical protein
MTSTGPEATAKSTIELLRDGVPDWNSIDFDVNCSRCGYNLRTLTNPRCPECGFQFEWRALIEGFQNSSIHLFEHTWRKKPIRGYLGALWQPLFRPKKFWKRVSLHDRIKAKPLWVMAFLAAGLCLQTSFGIGVGIGLMSSGVFYFNIISRPPASYWTDQVLSTNSLLLALECMESHGWNIALYPLEFSKELVFTVAAAFLIVLLLVGITSTLHETIAQYKLRPAHMLRVVAYAAGPAAVQTGMIAAVLPVLIICLPFQFGDLWRDGCEPIDAILLSLPTFMHLRSGLKYYLGIPHAALASLLCIIAAFLSSVVCIMIVLVVFRINY